MTDCRAALRGLWLAYLASGGGLPSGLSGRPPARAAAGFRWPVGRSQRKLPASPGRRRRGWRDNPMRESRRMPSSAGPCKPLTPANVVQLWRDAAAWLRTAFSGCLACGSRRPTGSTPGRRISPPRRELFRRLQPRLCQIQCHLGSIASSALRAHSASSSLLAVAARNAAITQGSRLSTKQPTMTKTRTWL